MHGKYFELIHEYHSAGFAFSVSINWNIPEITGKIDSNGYIVQYFRRKSEPANFLVDDIKYFEAWKIENGLMTDYDADRCDDCICVDTDLFGGINIILKKSLGTCGKYIIDTEVYWIPKTDSLYDIVDKWSIETVKQANGLKGDYSFEGLSEEYLVFKRP